MRKDTLIQGTPNQIITQLANEIKDALEAAHIPPSGVHAIALMHVAVSIVRNHKDYGRQPSFANMLSLMIMGLTGQPLTKEEEDRFNQEFAEIIKSLGGGLVNQENTPSFISPPHEGVH